MSTSYSGFAPTPAGINWPDLVARAERLSVPVSRRDEHGRTHIIRTLKQLKDDSEIDPT